MPNAISLQLNGRASAARLPSLFTSAARSAGQPSDPFLPDGYLVATGTFDVSAGARSAGEGRAPQVHATQADELVVLELTDGSTLITSAARLRDSLALTRPELLGPDGAILLEKLRSDGASRGLLDDAGAAIGGLVSKVFTFAAGQAKDAIIDDAIGQVGDIATLGVSWAGTRALMWAVEKRLGHEPGLYHWAGASGQASDLEPIGASAWWKQPGAQPAARPMLVFVHGTASSTLGSFGDLRNDPELFGHLERRFPGGVWAYEHRTLSDSPIENAIALARTLPPGAHVSLVSHSRGGLVADLLCLGEFDAHIDGYRYRFEGTGDADPDEARRVIAELRDAHAGQRDQLRELAALLRERKLVVQRYVRAASPASGTKLASGNFDLFLSGLLTLIGQVPFFFGSPVYSAFKRIVIEIARNRTNPHLVPGIEAMLPDSPLARLLRDAPVREGVVMSVLAGDIEGGNLLRRFGVMLTDFLLFDSEDNDLVVNTSAMLAGVAPRVNARVLFDRGADVSHFRYFVNLDTRVALRDWLVSDDPDRLQAFHALPAPQEYEQALAAASARRDVGGDERPVVVVLPGVMGSHLNAGGTDRVWFDPLDIASGGLAKVAWGASGVEAEELFGMFYGKLCEELSTTHRVERYAYDWRQPLDVLAERFGEYLDRLLAQTQQPVRLLAHSMGGLVVRATIHKRRPVMDRLMSRDGARLVMLGTPNQGAHSMVENLLGKGDTLRTLVRLDVTHDMQQVLDIVAGFRGALQLLPKPGFKDIFQGQSDGGAFYDYQDPQTWQAFKLKVRDFWFGDHRCGTPDRGVLDSASWLWSQDGKARPSLPAAYEAKSVYVFGTAPNTPCGVREDANGRLRMVGTTRGDDTVTWESGRIGGIARFYYMPAAHGDLPATREHFPALLDLLNGGATHRLATTPPSVRAIEQPAPVSYDAGPPGAEDADALQRSLLGGSPRDRVAVRPKRRLEVSVRAMDLRFVTKPLMVGHYEQDPIAGPQALIDRELLAGDLRERHDLGLYAGPRGTAVVVLRVPNGQERLRGSLRGAVVTGLGAYNGALGMSDLTEAVRAGALRYLLQVVDVLGPNPREVSLATLLLGYNSSANLSIPAAMEALVRGVMEANARFSETTHLGIHIAALDVVELYLDTAITAVYSLRQLAPRLAVQAARQGTALVCHGELVTGEGARQRLFDNTNSSYWPRLIVTDADRDEADGNPDAARTPHATPTALADRLRYLYVGQRARAESVMQQRQPGLIEKLVRQQIGFRVWNEDFGRTLFQLMVPHDFKDAARQLDRVVLVVDSTTANLPWELMLADDPTRSDGDKRPLALRTAVVRQLSSSRFRRQVRQAIERTALVVGNPSVEGFDTSFVDAKGQAVGLPPPLPGAQAEAQSVFERLTGMGYATDQVIGDEQSAVNVLSKLYHRPWRMLHVSAHGVFNLRHVDGRARSGVVLSDGLMITAAEIAAMEVVPELVFLNCCHLGTVDIGREGNKLAASVARELIDIGVRCVVVAGWAVSDDCAQLFGQTFYDALLMQHQPFGDAVFTARVAVWEQKPDDITWGAFQAYGDPGWIAERGADGARNGGGSEYVSVEELLDDLARTRADLSRRSERLTERDIRGIVDATDRMLGERCPPGWRDLPQVLAAFGAVWLDLGEFERARSALLAAVRAEDRSGRVGLRDIEKLANVEARLGEKRAQAEIDADPGAVGPAFALIDGALARLDMLDALVAPGAAAAGGNAPLARNRERCALRGGAWKRKASLHARRLLAGGGQALSAARADEARAAMLEALVCSVDAYRCAEGRPGSADFSTYLALNRLALDALTDWPSPAARQDAIALARQCLLASTQAFAREPNAWDAVMQAESGLVEAMLDGRLSRDDDVGAATLEDLARAYAEAIANVMLRPAQIDSIVTQMELLSRLWDALSIGPQGDAAQVRCADRLLALAQRLQPGRPARSDRPVPAPARPAPAARRPPRPRRHGAPK